MGYGKSWYVEYFMRMNWKIYVCVPGRAGYGGSLDGMVRV